MGKIVKFIGAVAVLMVSFSSANACDLVCELELNRINRQLETLNDTLSRAQRGAELQQELLYHFESGPTCAVKRAEAVKLYGSRVIGMDINCEPVLYPYADLEGLLPKPKPLSAEDQELLQAMQSGHLVEWLEEHREKAQQKP